MLVASDAGDAGETSETRDASAARLKKKIQLKD